MGTRLTASGTERVYAAAAKWVDCALRNDGSLFTPGESIWSSRWLGELHDRFLDKPDESSDSFSEKLLGQLRDSQPEVYQLMGEALFFYFLIVKTKNSANERSVIDPVLFWSPSPVAIPEELIASLTPGIVNPGTFFYTGRPYQVGFLIEFVEQWKETEPDEQARLLTNPWEFKNFVMGIDFHSELLRGHANRPRIQREALLHLVFPDTFEAIVSVEHKEKIVKAFARFVVPPEQDVDRQLQQVRQGLEGRFESRDSFFYAIPEIKDEWYKQVAPPPPQEPWSPANIDALARNLLWEPKQLQEIIEDLQEKRQVIFHGPPGTGKTYVAREIAKQCRLNGGDFEIVQFHPSYSYEDFVEGFRPKVIGGQSGFELVHGPLRRIAEQAKKNPKATFILVIDELNRGNVSKVFGELYFLLEYRDEEVRLQYGRDDERFSLPENLWFICTMNTADRSIALMDAALRRRFYFAPFFPDGPPVQGLLRRWLEREGKETLAADLIDAANAKLDRDTGIGPSYFMKANTALDEIRVRRIWERAVLPYVEEQCFGEDEKLKGFGFDLLVGQLNSASPLEAQPAEETAPAQGDDADTDSA